MGLEIERKFLVAGDSWRSRADTGTPLAQGYLCSGQGRTVRVRLADDRAWLTIKGPTEGMTRQEFEYPIPAADAGEILALCEGTVIEKTRYRVPHAGCVWEVDVFAGANAPLVVAEVELAHAEQEVALPDWVGREVTDDVRYRNSSLAQRPFSRW
jgi:adenylate cyclase